MFCLPVTCAGQLSLRPYLDGARGLRGFESLRDSPAAFHFASALADGLSGPCVAGGSLAGNVSFNESSTALDAAAFPLVVEVCALDVRRVGGTVRSCRSASSQSCSAVPSGQPRACQS